MLSVFLKKCLIQWFDVATKLKIDLASMKLFTFNTCRKEEDLFKLFFPTHLFWSDNMLLHPLEVLHKPNFSKLYKILPPPPPSFSTKLPDC